MGIVPQSVMLDAERHAVAVDKGTLVPALAPALMADHEVLNSMTEFTLLPAYVAAPGFDAYKAALKVRSDQ
jgi:hypothetical protein